MDTITLLSVTLIEVPTASFIQPWKDTVLSNPQKYPGLYVLKLQDDSNQMVAVNPMEDFVKTLRSEIEFVGEIEHPVVSQSTRPHPPNPTTLLEYPQGLTIPENVQQEVVSTPSLQSVEECTPGSNRMTQEYVSEMLEKGESRTRLAVDSGLGVAQVTRLYAHIRKAGRFPHFRKNHVWGPLLLTEQTNIPALGGVLYLCYNLGVSYSKFTHYFPIYLEEQGIPSRIKEDPRHYWRYLPYSVYKQYRDHVLALDKSQNRGGGWSGGQLTLFGKGVECPQYPHLDTKTVQKVCEYSQEFSATEVAVMLGLPPTSVIRIRADLKKRNPQLVFAKYSKRPVFDLREIKKTDIVPVNSVVTATGLSPAFLYSAARGTIPQMSACPSYRQGKFRMFKSMEITTWLREYAGKNAIDVRE